MSAERGARPETSVLRTLAAPDEECEFVVLGGGLPGLVAARTAALAGRRVVLLEGADSLGGSIARVALDGELVDVGAQTFDPTAPGMARLLRQLGLDHLVETSPRTQPYMASRRGVHPLPADLVLGVPAHPLAPDVRSVLGLAGALRAQLDRVRSGRGLATPYTMRMARKRLGKRVVERLMGPIVEGIYSASPVLGNIDRLDVALLTESRRERSMSRGAERLLSAGRDSLDPIATLRGGLATLIDALADDCRRLGVDIRTGQRVASVRRPTSMDGAASGAGLYVALEHGTVIEAESLLSALPVTDAARVFALSRTTLANREWTATPSIERVVMVVDAPGLDGSERGTVLVASEVSESEVRAVTVPTVLWQSARERFGAGRHVVTVQYGSVRTPRASKTAELIPAPTATLSAEAMLATALADASRALGVELRESAVRDWARRTTAVQVPSSVLVQGQLARAARAEVHQQPGLEVTGQWIAGVGLANAVVDAETAVLRLLGER